MKKLSIILVNYNGWKDTKVCLESLSTVVSDLVEISVIVVDNASAADISQQLSDFSKQYQHISISLIAHKENAGFSGGNNSGIRQAMHEEADYIMLLNNDTIVDRQFVDPLIMWLEKHETTGIVGPKIYFATGYEFHQDRYTDSEKGNVIWYAGGLIDWDNVYASHRGVDEVDIGQYNQPSKTAFVSGCCMVFSRRLVEKIGYLDDHYFMYLEDVDYCMRAVRAGYELWFIPDSHVYHKNAQSSGSAGSDLHVYYQTRNRLYFGMKYARFRTKLALLKHSLHVIKSNKKRRDAVTDFYLMKFGKNTSLHRDKKL